jgi:hypothetical protein
MSRPRLLSIAVCFGIGLALGQSIPEAQALSCATNEQVYLTLSSIDGDGDVSVEEAFWLGEAFMESYEGTIDFRVTNPDGQSQWNYLSGPEVGS